jgi:diguanylate cyclase (GGDEF)-like protein
VGGEEFAVLLRNPGPDVALDVGERVRAAVRALDLTALGVPAVSVSVGVANSNGPDEPIPAIVDRADRALYRAKRGGRDRVIAA